ncbi:MAG: metal-dependent hydrolase, partial [Oceanidesulfovibrio sp.]
GVAPRKGVFAVVMFAAFSHLYLDAFTIYGVAPLAPFSDYHIALDATWFLDPIFLVLLASLFLAPVIFRTRARVTGWLGVLLILAYPWGLVGAKQWAGHKAEALLQTNGAVVKNVSVHPDFLSPLFWKIVTRNEHAYEVRSFNALSRSIDQIPTLYEAAPPTLMDRLAQESELVAAFLSRTRMPIIFRREGGNITRLVIADINMVSVTPWVKGQQPDGAPPMSILVELGLDGALLNARMRYLGRYLSFEELPVSPQANASNGTIAP